MNLDSEKCTSCEICFKECPLSAIEMVESYPQFGQTCVRCGLCATVCPVEAITPPEAIRPDGIVCDHCPVGCEIPPGHLGACQRYRHDQNQLKPARPLVMPPKSNLENRYRQALIGQPVITGIGAGGTYPDYNPAPLTAQKKIEGIDVVTVVSESPLTYSSIMLKIDTDRFVGSETAAVKYRGAEVGHVTTEQYGSKMISIGGINIMKGKHRFKATRLMVAIANGEPFKLTVEKGAKLDLKVGQPPIIAGRSSEAMKVACGAGIMGIFGPQMKDLADEIIVLDPDITGLFSESHVGHVLGFKPSGLRPPGRLGTPGRYFGSTGNGWGGTEVTDAIEAFEIIDPDKIRPGMKLLILEVTGQQAALLQADSNKTFHPLPIPAGVEKINHIISSNMEAALTSAVYMGGSGGSSRAGITPYPLKLTQAVHQGEIKLSVGGVPAYVMPGGGINFLVDVGPMRWRPFSWTPSPAVVAPLEYTMASDTYHRLNGPKQNLQLIEDVYQKWETREWEKA